jgi:cytochrome bd ubiquinol oxidase subunit I
MVRMAVGVIAVLAPLQAFIGDQHGLNTLEHQPIKIAAMEAHWDGSKPGALVLFAWPDEKAEINRFELSIPKGASLILKHDPDGLFPGLKSVPPANRPPVVTVFFAFRIMVGIGLTMILIGMLGVWLWWRGRLFESSWYLRPVAHGWWLGFVAIISGWVVTESGRQPWLVHGLLRTADGISPVPGASIASTLAR